MAQKKFTIQLDQPAAAEIGMRILSMLDGHTVEESTTILNGVTVALVSLCKDVSKHVTDEGSVERLVLSWLSATDPASGCHFSDYINIPKK